MRVGKVTDTAWREGQWLPSKWRFGAEKPPTLQSGGRGETPLGQVLSRRESQGGGAAARAGSHGRLDRLECNAGVTCGSQLFGDRKLPLRSCRECCDVPVPLPRRGHAPRRGLSDRSTGTPAESRRGRRIRRTVQQGPGLGGAAGGRGRRGRALPPGQGLRETLPSEGVGRGTVPDAGPPCSAREERGVVTRARLERHHAATGLVSSSPHAPAPAVGLQDGQSPAGARAAGQRAGRGVRGRGPGSGGKGPGRGRTERGCAGVSGWAAAAASGGQEAESGSTPQKP